MKLSDDLLKEYDRTGMTHMLDIAIRVHCEIPHNRYYTVSFYPPEKHGQVEIDHSRTRALPPQKISKSDQ